MLTKIRHDNNHWVGSSGPVLVLFWLREVDPEACRQLLAIAREHAQRQPHQRVAVLSISGPGTRPPGAEARAALAELMRGAETHVARVAVVREGRGFMASAVSSIVTNLRLLARPNLPHAFFHDLDHAVRWVEGGLAPGLVNPPRLRRQIERQAQSLGQRHEAHAVGA